MKTIDLASWPRREQFEFFRGMDYPHFNLTANVGLSEFYRYVKAQNFSFFKCMVYIACRTANEIPEFRLRIRGNEVVEHDIVHPAFTILRPDEVFAFCPADYKPDFAAFYAEAAQCMEQAKKSLALGDEPHRDDQLFITSIPWVSFTSLTHPIHMHPVDSVPRLAWGKYFEENGQRKLPFSIQAHHALMDGLHAGKYFMLLQEHLDHPETVLQPVPKVK